MKYENEVPSGKNPNKVKKGLMVAAGFISLSLGLLGIPLPLLPTTPFLLLSAWLFARSSPRFYRWLINHRYLGQYIRNYREKGGVTRNVKIASISLLWITIGLSVLLAVSLLWVRLLLLIIATAVSIHILSLKTIK